MTTPVAVAITVKDEERSIPQLLDGLFAQTLQPSQVLVTDCGSTDRTVEMIERYMAKGYPIKLQQAPGARRGRGRNLAIAATSCDWIAIIDAGCVPEPQWLETLWAGRLTSPSPRAVFGVVRPVTGSLFTECASTASFPAMRLSDGRKALRRSVASLLIHRSVWTAVGGFPEASRSGEDLIFIRRMDDAGVAAGLASRAIVHWEIPTTLRATMSRFVNYSQYGLEAGLGSTWHYRAFMYYAVAVTLLVLGAVDSPWWLALLAGLCVLRVVKTVCTNEKEKRGFSAFAPRRLILIGGILLAIDLATLYGTLKWLRGLWGAQMRQVSVI